MSNSTMDCQEIGYFGGCPECGKTDGYSNVGSDHWFVCDEHKTRWCAGSNLFSDWRGQSEETHKRNKQWLEAFRIVEPVYPERGPAHDGKPGNDASRHARPQIVAGRDYDGEREAQPGKALETDEKRLVWLRALYLIQKGDRGENLIARMAGYCLVPPDVVRDADAIFNGNFRTAIRIEAGAEPFDFPF